jgi:hypothetical protein
MGRQSAKIALSSANSAKYFRFCMEAIPEGSETIVTTEPEPEPPVDPVEEFKKGKAKRETKRKQVVIQEYVPPEPKSDDVESIASRVAEMLFAKMGREEADLDKTPEEKVKTRPKPKPPAKKKEVSPPPTKYFGWC